MRLGTLLHFYGQRVRTNLRAEILAGAGIAVGVALLLAIVVANTSIGASAGQISRGIAGDATLQLNARGDGGFPATVLNDATKAPAVEQAAGVLEHRVILAGPHGRRSVLLVGVDLNLLGLGGTLMRSFIARYGLQFGTGLYLPTGIVRQVGLAPAPRGQTPKSEGSVTVRARGSARRAPVAAVLGTDLVGSLSQAGVAIGMLPYVQELTGYTGRLTRILVKPRPGRQDEARRQLAAIGGDDLTVTTPDHESDVLAQAAGPNDQSTNLFAAISALVGLLLAFNAMLLTTPARRREMAELRKHGYTPRQVTSMVIFDALLLGCLASAVGVGLGILLAQTLFGGVPTYLSFAFPLGSQQVIRCEDVLLAVAGGIGATLLSAALPLLDLLPSRSTDAVDFSGGEPGQALGPRARRRGAIAALVLVVVAIVGALAVPSTTVAAIAVLAVATMLVLPMALSGVVSLADRLSRSHASLHLVSVAAIALRSARLRSIALAATGAVAIFGSVAIEGAHRDLETGLHASFSEYLQTTDLWVTTGGDDLTTQSFPTRDGLARIRAVPAVADARAYYGGLFDVGDRRAWLIARPSADRSMLPTEQIAEGNGPTADAALRRGGAVAVSTQIAEQQDVRVGRPIVLATPTGPRSFVLAATLTNLGWGPGAIVINAADYRHFWATQDPTALEVDLRPGADVATAKGAVRDALGPARALTVQTADERVRQYDALARGGLERLTNISTLLLAAAALALATAICAAIWQRRDTFAAYRQYGYRPWQIWSAVMIETGLVLATGCGLGAFVGVGGQWLLSRWLSLTTGFPAPFDLSIPATLLTFLKVSIFALLVVAYPSYRAVRAPRETSVQP